MSIGQLGLDHKNAGFFQALEESAVRGIRPIILAGGSGTRLWPLSRKSYPKQFSKLLGEYSLFQQTALRLTPSGTVDFQSPIITTHSDFRFLVGDQLRAVGADAAHTLIEPEGKNTGPAILAATLSAMEENPEAVLLAAPADHFIANLEAFHGAVAQGLEEVEKGRIVTFGITPTHAETQYGYLELSTKSKSEPVSLKSFVEKPDAQSAQEMLDAGTFLWNAGIFMFSAKDMLSAFDAYARDLLEPVQNALEFGETDLGSFRLDPASWTKCRSISIDFAVMEHAQNLVVVSFADGWSDLGGWQSVGQHMKTDTNGVALSQNARAIDCKNTVLRSENEGLELVGLGLENIIAVAMPDAVLVAHQDRAHEVKDAVTLLKSEKIKQAEIFPKDHRPWGWFETLVIKDRFQVKQILVKPGAALSLQSHHHRSEHWVVVEGTARVTVDNEVKLISEGQSVYIPLGARHRLENPGKLPMVLIEIQTGGYLGEDDIVRYEDAYNRS